MIWRLATQSLWSRRFVSILLVASLSLSVFLVMSVERLRLGTRESFSEAVSQVDLLVGARTGPLHLLLYSIFGLGNATNNIDYESFQDFKNHRAVEWAIPISLGDSHRGFRVVATSEEFYKHFRFRKTRSLSFVKGHPPQGPDQVAIGAQVARELKYDLGTSIVLSHGMSGDGPDAYQHEDRPFKIVGVLEATQTPIDWSLYISLEGMELIHVGWDEGAPPSTTLEIQQNPSLPIKTITSFLLRTKNRIDSVYLQREINDYAKEPLMAVAPGVVLAEFWTAFRFFEISLQSIALVVAATALIGLFLALMISAETRRREMLILRAIGLNARKILSLLLIEVGVLSMLGIFLGALVTYISFGTLSTQIERWSGVAIQWTSPSSFELSFVAVLFALSLLSALLPALRLYRQTRVLPGQNTF